VSDVEISKAALSVISAVIVALMALMGVLMGQLWSRLSALEARVGKATEYNHRLWEWARKMLDLYYRHRRPGSPDPDPIPIDD